MDAVSSASHTAPSSLVDELSAHLRAQAGLVFSPTRLATYLTALQTKGFVILSGISGTGKTRLAQACAALLGDEEASNYLFVSVQPDWRDNRALLGYYNPLTEKYESTDLLRFVLDAQREVTMPAASMLQTWLEAKYRTERVRTWLARFAALRERLQGKRPEQMDEEDLAQFWRGINNGVASIGRAGGIRADRRALIEATSIAMDGTRSVGDRYISIVQAIQAGPEAGGGDRQQWARAWRAIATFDPGAAHTIVHGRRVRDLLRQLNYDHAADPRHLAANGDAQAISDAAAFLLAEARKVRPQGTDLELAICPWLLYEYYFEREAPEGEAPGGSITPFFLLLDEMNLARVEHYFADFLSVLEGGRAPDGFTRETIRLHHFETPVKDAANQAIPPEIRLPPNLYIVGTVNVDDSTHGFSPKVLDRAFTLEFEAADLTGYPPELVPESPLGEEIRQDLFAAFSRSGRFCQIDKAVIRAFHEMDPSYTQRLADLETRLRPHDLHFGYRIVDEIVMFLANAQESGWFASAGGLPAAFDHAVCMKVLPKFHGSRLRLEEALWSILEWAGTPDGCRAAFQKEVDESLGRAYQVLDGALQQATLPAIAWKCGRMLRNLYATGYASFS